MRNLIAEFLISEFLPELPESYQIERLFSE